MAPGRRRGAKRVKTKEDLNLGDLVLAKIKGFPAWPAKISRPEDWEHQPDPKKYFVQFFGTAEIAFVAPADIQSFTSEVKNKLSARCQGKKVRYFAQAVKEISEEFEQLQQKVSTAGRNDESTQTPASEARPLNTGMENTLESDGNNCIDSKDNLDLKGSNNLASGVEHCLQRQCVAEFQEVKPCLSDEMNSDVLTSVSSGKKNDISIDHTIVASDSVPVSSPCLKEQSPRDSKSEGMCSDTDHGEVTNRKKQKLARGSKKKSEATMRQTRGSRLDLDAGEKKENVLIKDNIDSEAVNDSHRDPKADFEEPSGSTSKKKVSDKNGQVKQKPQPNKSSVSAKLSKSAETRNGMVKGPLNRASDSENRNISDDKIKAIANSKRLVSGGKAKAENHLAKVQTVANMSNNSTDEDDLPPTKRQCRALAKTPSPALISENRLGSSSSRKNDLTLLNKVLSPVTQLPKKRRAVRICDDEDDESPKTPVHGGYSNKASDIPCVADREDKHIMHGESNVENQPVSRNSAVLEQVHSEGVSKNTLSPTTQQEVELKTGELSGAHPCPDPLQLDAENLPSKPVSLSPKEAKPISSPKKSPFVGVTGPSTEQQSKHHCKTPCSVPLKRIPAVDTRNTAAFDRPSSIIDQSVGERSKLASGEKRKITAKSDLQTNGPVFEAGTKNDCPTSFVERVDVGKDDKASFPIDFKRSVSDLSMKHLIAAAQARKRQAHSQSSYGNPLHLLYPEADTPRTGPNPILAESKSESCEMPQLDQQGLHSSSPSHLNNFSSHEIENNAERRVSPDHQVTASPLNGGTEAAVVRDAFEGMIETLSRTKESIGRATRLAIDCAKHGIANEVVELLILKLENESSSHRRVDLFFLIDSITQYSHSQRGIAGASYIPIVQAALPRLIGAVAPAGTGAQENRRQCRKVLRLWLERKILPESILRQYVDNMGVVNDNAPAGSRRPSRAERAFDDPIREMEGMVVDEYGSNTNFELPGLLSAHLFNDDEENEDMFQKKLCDADDDDSASPTNLLTDINSYPDNCNLTPSDRRHCVLKDVDGELEMEDVSGQTKAERQVFNSKFERASLERDSDGFLESSVYISPNQLPSPEGSPPLPPGSPPVTPPLPTSPPPSTPPQEPLPPPPSSASLLPPPPSSSQQHLYPQSPVCLPPPVGLPPTTPVGRPQSIGLAPPPVGTHLPPVDPSPPMLSQQSFPPQPQFISQHMPPLPPAISRSPQSSYQPPLPHDVGGPPLGNQSSHMVPITHGSSVDGCVRSDIQSQQASCIPAPAVSSAREHVAYNSSRQVEYGQGDAYMNPRALQHQQKIMSSGAAPLARRPGHPELPPRGPPDHFSYPNSIPPPQYPSYTMPRFSEDPRRYAIDEQWRVPVGEPNVDYPPNGWVPQGRSCSGQPFSHEGYFGPPPERPLASTANFPPSCPNHLPSGAHFRVHGGSIMPNRPDLFGVNQ